MHRGYSVASPPARFLVQAVTRAADAPWLQIMVFVRDGADVPWKIMLVTGASGNEEYTPAVEFPMLDDEGYNIVPETPWLDPRDVMPSLARYWNSILETGAPPASGPPFDDGFWPAGWKPNSVARTSRTPATSPATGRITTTEPRSNGSGASGSRVTGSCARR